MFGKKPASLSASSTTDCISWSSSTTRMDKTLRPTRSPAMLFGFATRQLTAKPALNCLPAIADLLDRFLHGSLGPAGLLRLVSDLVILSTSYARPILLAP